jgi:hypothetical protein
LIVSYLPEAERHPLWADIVKILNAATLDGARVIDTDELVWIAYEGSVLFGAGTTIAYDDGEVRILACGGFKHREWVGEAIATVTAWARDCGARKITMRGRKGWARYFAGWDCSQADERSWLFQKDLTGA